MTLREGGRVGYRHSQSMGPLIPPGDGVLGNVCWILILPVVVSVALLLFG
jgi:hypothetical protein